MRDHLYNPDPDSGRCDRCDKEVVLTHDPPQPCGRLLCPDHDPCDCEECADVL